jgi:hypothetical protein
MSIKIIDNQKVEMTDDEFQYYQDICKNYDRPNYQGKEIFKSLFEVDDRGIIVFIKPPSTRQTSMEAYLFITSIFWHQHMRLLHQKVDNFLSSSREEFNKLISEIKSANNEASNKTEENKTENKK